MKNKYCLLGLLLLTTAGTAFGQDLTDRYIAFFSDKQGTPYSVDAPEEFLSARAIARRTEAGIAITEQDLPVNPDYISQVQATGATPYFGSRWMNAVLFEANRDQREAVAALGIVDSILYVARGPLVQREDPSGRPTPMPATKTLADHQNATQNELLGIADMHAQGYRGEGTLIAVFDGGFEGADVSTPFQHMINTGRVLTSYDFVGNRSYPYDYDDHGTRALSTIAALATSGTDTTYIGTAYNAEFILCVTEDVPVEYRIEEFNWLFGAELADSAGADIIHSSLGYSDGFSDITMDYSREDMDGETTIIAQAAQFAADRGIVVVTSAGNSGGGSWGIVTSPADVADVVSVGAVVEDGSYATFSSRGANSDPIKPDVAAMGVSTRIVNDLGNITSGNGTSFSAPQVAGLAAGMMQAFPELSTAEIRQALRNSGSQYQSPDTLLGYGIPNFTRAQYLLVVGLLDRQAIELGVYPNPTSGDQITLELPEAFQQPNLEIIGYNQRGQEIYRQQFATTEPALPLSIQNWPSGTYLLRVQAGGTLGWARVFKP